MFNEINKFANEATATATDNFTSTSDQLLDAVLDGNRRAVDFAVAAADRVNDQFAFELPFADRLPTPTVAGERYLEFVERAVSLNREMNERVVEMIKADTAKPAVQTPAAEKPAAKKSTARKSTAKKSTARKSTAKKTAATKAAATK